MCDHMAQGHGLSSTFARDHHYICNPPQALLYQETKMDFSHPMVVLLYMARVGVEKKINVAFSERHFSNILVYQTSVFEFISY